ncbi:hypothetical protein CEXT_707561 [Caerostris extrusa]|uniref:Uncharacterized protein n=1 Tax=Caerostris extrusa TaxID=172846 RepID=A0AAV4Y7W4_CAEEX|nr:hypothetical protein CEXT_707561 [Caerostris extrusa]
MENFFSLKMLYIRTPVKRQWKFFVWHSYPYVITKRRLKGAETAAIHNDKEQSKKSPSEKQQQTEAVSNIADTCEVGKEASNILQEQYFLLKSDEKLLLPQMLYIRTTCETSVEVFRLAFISSRHHEKKKGAETAAIHYDTSSLCKEQFNPPLPNLENNGRRKQFLTLPTPVRGEKKTSNILQEQYFLFKSDERLLLSEDVIYQNTCETSVEVFVWHSYPHVITKEGRKKKRYCAKLFRRKFD